jgi:hypothetical protein
VQQVEINRGRPEARCLIRFDATAEQTGFPAVQQAARLTRYIDRAKPKDEGIETEWLLSSRPHVTMSAEAMYWADRRYWGIENGLHLRLDVTAGEDRSRVRLPRAALNLAMIRRATVSLAVHWITRCPNNRQATLQGFYDFMTARNARKAFSLVSASKPSWLPQ